MKITGELLKSERKKLKLSQQDIAFALKLSPRVINAIEEGDVDNLPAKTFVRGFIKSYAEMLKLNSTTVLNQYHEEMGTASLNSKLISTSNEPIKKKPAEDSPLAVSQEISTVTPNLKVSLNRNTFKVVVLITAAVIILGGINQIINKYQKEGLQQETPHLSVETINQEVNAAKEIEQPTEEPEPAVESEAEEQVVEVKPPTPAPEASEIVKSKATLGKSIEMVIEATRDTVISYATGTDSQFKTLNLKKDTLQIIKSKNGLHVKITEGDAVLVTVNGIHRGQAASDTKPVELTY